MYLNITLNLHASFDVNEAEKRLIDQIKRGRISHLGFISMHHEQASLQISEDQRIPALCVVLFLLFWNEKSGHDHQVLFAEF